MSEFSINKLPFDVLMMTAKKIAAIRKNRKWTQKELAERSGVSFGSVKRFETTGQVSFESLLKIAEALGRLSEFENILEVRDEERLRKLFNPGE